MQSHSLLTSVVGAAASADHRQPDCLGDGGGASPYAEFFVDVLEVRIDRGSTQHERLSNLRAAVSVGGERQYLNLAWRQWGGGVGAVVLGRVQLGVQPIG